MVSSSATTASGSSATMGSLLAWFPWKFSVPPHLRHTELPECSPSFCQMLIPLSGDTHQAMMSDPSGSRSASAAASRIRMMRMARFISPLLVALILAGCGSHRSAKEHRVCVGLHENQKLMAAVLAGKPTALVRNPTPATVVTRQLGEPDRKLLTRDRLNYWWVYGNTAYFVVSYNAPGQNFVAGKACDWKYTSRLLGIHR
jgi:hypothetical protein